MPRLFGIAGVQMSVVPWDVEATVAKMTDAVIQISRSFPWVQMVVFHELAVSGMVQFVSAPATDSWQKTYQPIPGPATERLADCARQTRKWLVPGSMYELDGENL